MSGIGMTEDSEIEIISAYSTSNQVIPAVDMEPGYYVVGTFFLPITSNARLEILGCVSDPSLTLTAFIYDLNAKEVVSGSQAQLAQVLDDRGVSGSFVVTGGRMYQVRAQVVGASGDGLFGSLKASQLIGG